MTTKYDYSGNSFYSKMFKGYVITALWSTTDCDSGDSFNAHYDFDDFSEDAKRSMWEDCVAFADETEGIRGDISADDMGHNFWLNRNGHGAGFWDRDYSGVDGCDGDTGNKLSAASKVWGGCDLYVGDDGQLYL